MQGADPVPPAPPDLEAGGRASERPSARRRRHRLLGLLLLLALGIASVCAWLASEGAFSEGSGFWRRYSPTRTSVSVSPYDSPDSSSGDSSAASPSQDSDGDGDDGDGGNDAEPDLPRGFVRRSAAGAFVGIFSNSAHDVIFEVPSRALGKPFVVDALASKADGKQTLYHSPIADVDADGRVFELHLGTGGTSLDLVKPELGLRARSGTAYARVLENAAWSGWERTFELITTHERAGERYLYVDVTQWARDGCGALSFAADARKARMAGVGGYARNVWLEAEYRFETKDDDGYDEVTLLGVHYALAMLPDEPAPARALDERVGYFASRYVELGAPPEGALSAASADRVVRMIHRWRLEPSGATVTAADGRSLDVPKAPITFYVDPSVPLRWRAPLAEGVLRWGRAFEAAGWADAIAVVTPGDDAWPDDYDAGDMRFSTISWAVSTQQTYAVAPSTADPRSGEILNSDILFTHSWIRAWLDDWETADGRSSHSVHEERHEGAEGAERPRHVRALKRLGANRHAHQGPCGLSHAHEHGVGGAHAVRRAIRAASAEADISEIDSLPAEFAAQALADVAMHEVGHALGLRHNFKGSAALPWAQLGNRSFTAEHGLTASVMDYLPPVVHADPSRQGDFFTPTLGAYDMWAIEYGYTRVRSAAELARIAARVQADDRLQFGTDEDEPGPEGTDHTVARWDVGSEPLDYAENALELAAVLLAEAAAQADAPLSPPPPRWPPPSHPPSPPPLPPPAANGSAALPGINGTGPDTPSTPSNQATVPRGSRPFALAARVSEALRPISTAAVIAAKHVGGIERAKRGELGAVMRPTSAAQTRRALRVLERVLTDERLVPSASLWPHLAAPAGWCDGIGDYCLGTRAVDVLAQMRSLRARALKLVLQPSRLQSAHLGAWALSSVGNESVPTADVLRALTAAVWSEPLDASAAGLFRQLQREHAEQLQQLAAGKTVGEASVLAARELTHLHSLAMEAAAAAHNVTTSGAVLLPALDAHLWVMTSSYL